MNRIIGLVVFAVGVVLLVFAYNSSNAPLEELSNTITGRYSDETMWYLVIGIAAVVGGGLLAAFGSRR
jgi:drug/metabolite transporter (DMT)-like permease